MFDTLREASLKCVVSILTLPRRGAWVFRAYWDGWEHSFTPHPNGQFLAFRGVQKSKRLPRWFVHFLAHFGNGKKTDKKIGFERKRSTLDI